MAKSKTHYVCQSCGRTAAKPLGKCPACGEWDTYTEEILEGVAPGRALAGLATVASWPQPLAKIEGHADERMALSIGEFARVLGGGVVPGSLV